MKLPQEAARDLFNENYLIFAELSTNMSEDILVSVLSIKFAVKECNAIVKALSPVDYAERKYYNDIISELQKNDFTVIETTNTVDFEPKANII